VKKSEGKTPLYKYIVVSQSGLDKQPKYVKISVLPKWFFLQQYELFSCMVKASICHKSIYLLNFIKIVNYSSSTKNREKNGGNYFEKDA
jgi:hypothetical protein